MWLENLIEQFNENKFNTKDKDEEGDEEGEVADFNNINNIDKLPSIRNFFSTNLNNKSQQKQRQQSRLSQNNNNTKHHHSGCFNCIERNFSVLSMSLRQCGKCNSDNKPFVLRQDRRNNSNDKSICLVLLE
jgi:hypothetical protein